MLSDYYENLTLITVTETPDGGGGFIASETETIFRGYVARLNAQEQLSSAQKKEFATARLFTDKSDISLTNKVKRKTVTYEVVGQYDFHHYFYELKQIE